MKHRTGLHIIHAQTLLERGKVELDEEATDRERERERDGRGRQYLKKASNSGAGFLKSVRRTLSFGLGFDARGCTGPLSARAKESSQTPTRIAHTHTSSAGPNSALVHDAAHCTDGQRQNGEDRQAHKRQSTNKRGRKVSPTAQRHLKRMI